MCPASLEFYSFCIDSGLVCSQASAVAVYNPISKDAQRSYLTYQGYAVQKLVG